jgi:hypothetical protein
MELRFDRAKGAVYNSWGDSKAQHTRHIVAWGTEKGFLDWPITDGGLTACFHYQSDPNVPDTKEASSGGYLTFYDAPCDRLRYRMLHLQCRATDVEGQADMGIRLVVDDPRLAGNRELVVYELPSLRSFATIDGTWRNIRIPISEFQQRHYRPPLPSGLDANTINKIVFFVDNPIVGVCRQGTLWISEIALCP